MAMEREPRSALPRLEPAVGLIDDVDAALAAHQAIVAVAAEQRFQRVTNFHDALWIRVLRAFLVAAARPVNARGRLAAGTIVI
jgi:hypothetical protein